MSSKKEPTAPPWLGGAAAMAAVMFTHPIDQTKIRSQLQRSRTSMLETARRTVRTSSVLGLWQGLTGSLLRQATYGAARFGIYAELKERDRRKGRKGSLVLNGAIAGLVSGIVGAPAELVMVRMCADGTLPVEQRSQYRNAFHGLYRIAKEDGLARCFHGIQLTTARSIVMNSTQLSAYDTIKRRLLKTGYFADSAPLHLLTATLGGTIAVTACAPIDVMKSRVQASRASSSSTGQIIADALRKEGVSVLFKGWVPAWWRMFPTTTLTFMFLEQLKKIYGVSDRK